MITIERIKEIVKKEFRRNLDDWGDYYMTKESEIYFSKNRYQKDYWNVAFEKTTKHNGSIELTNHKIATEKELMKMIRLFKKLRKAI